MSYLRTCLIGAVALLSATLAAAEAPASSAPDDIVVTGGRERAAELTRGLALGRISGMLPRWTEPVCVRMIGMRTDAAQQFEERVRSVARDAGAPVARDGCNPNLVVAFTDDAPGAAQLLHRRRPAMFVNRPVIERQRFIEGSDPVRWWSLTHAESADGMRPQGTAGEVPGLAFEGVGGGIDLPTIVSRDASLIRQPFMAGIGGTAVLVDSRWAEGVTLTALADYVAMVALTGTVMRATYGGASHSSIMGLFGSAEARRMAGMTAADRAYLSSLYALPAARLAWEQRGRLRSDVRAALVLQDLEAADGAAP